MNYVIEALIERSVQFHYSNDIVQGNMIIHQNTVEFTIINNQNENKLELSFTADNGQTFDTQIVDSSDLQVKVQFLLILQQIYPVLFQNAAYQQTDHFSSNTDLQFKQQQISNYRVGIQTPFQDSYYPDHTPAQLDYQPRITPGQFPEKQLEKVYHSPLVIDSTKKQQIKIRDYLIDKVNNNIT